MTGSAGTTNGTRARDERPGGRRGETGARQPPAARGRPRRAGDERATRGGSRRDEPREGGPGRLRRERRHARDGTGAVVARARVGKDGPMRALALADRP